MSVVFALGTDGDKAPGFGDFGIVAQFGGPVPLDGVWIVASLSRPVHKEDHGETGVGFGLFVRREEEPVVDGVGFGGIELVGSVSWISNGGGQIRLHKDLYSG